MQEGVSLSAFFGFLRAFFPGGCPSAISGRSTAGCRAPSPCHTSGAHGDGRGGASREGGEPPRAVAAKHRGGEPPRAMARRRDGDIAPYRQATRAVRTATGRGRAGRAGHERCAPPSRTSGASREGGEPPRAVARLGGVRGGRYGSAEYDRAGKAEALPLRLHSTIAMRNVREPSACRRRCGNRAA